jgi:hypothetical protein
MMTMFRVTPAGRSIFTGDYEAIVDMMLDDQTLRHVAPGDGSGVIIQYVAETTFFGKRIECSVNLRLPRVDVIPKLGDHAEIRRRMRNRAIVEARMRGRPSPNYVNNTTPMEVVHMQGAGVPISGLHITYRFDALLASVYAHNADAARVLVAASNDILGLAGGDIFLRELCIMQGLEAWQQCKCGDTPNQYAGFLVVAKWIRDNVAKLVPAARAICKTIMLEFDVPTGHDCANDPVAHAVLRERRIEIHGLLADVAQS